MAIPSRRTSRSLFPEDSPPGFQKIERARSSRVAPFLWERKGESLLFRGTSGGLRFCRTLMELLSSCVGVVLRRHSRNVVGELVMRVVRWGMKCRPPRGIARFRRDGAAGATRLPIGPLEPAGTLHPGQRTKIWEARPACFSKACGRGRDSGSAAGQMLQPDGRRCPRLWNGHRIFFS